MDLLTQPVAALLIALLISALVIPVMMRVAPRLGMIDKPDPRKVHRTPVPRVGGVGIAAGAMVAIALLGVASPMQNAYLIGALILSAFGAADDIREMGHYPKFIGQIVAAALVIWYGDVWISQVPFIGTPLPPILGKPFTLVAIVGIINAINHSDGLDGLAGGESLLSLGAMACLTYLTGNATLLLFIAAVGGGLLGFLRYNTWPARVFMGDLGSQFLGFSLAVLVLQLTQNVDPDISKSAALLLVGLPVVDIIAVLAQRIQAGMNWFRATRNHIHHRLLDLNFDHYQAVLVIYSVQLVLTVSGIFLAYESDALILLVYALVCGAVFAGLVFAERRGLKLRAHVPSWPARLAARMSQRDDVARLPLLFVQISVPAYLILTSVEVSHFKSMAPMWIYALGLAILLAILTALGWRRSPAIYRLALYSAIGMIAYCLYLDHPNQTSLGALIDVAYFALLAVAVAAAAVITGREEFSVTNLDFLIVAALVAAAVFARQVVGVGNFWSVAIETTLLLYGSELIILRSGQVWNRVLSGSALGALSIIVGKLVF